MSHTGVTVIVCREEHTLEFLGNGSYLPSCNYRERIFHTGPPCLFMNPKHWSCLDGAKFFCLFLLWLCINVLRDVGECCKSVPLDRTGSYIFISINITRILACIVQVDAFYYQSLSWYICVVMVVCCWFSSKLCISCVELEY